MNVKIDTSVIELKKKIEGKGIFGAWLSNEEIEWLIEKAKTLDVIADTWVAIETNGTNKDADNFYSIVQSILMPEQD